MFVVFSLPRSRSTWLSVFLGRNAPVGHDIYIGCGHPDDFATKLSELSGTCETGSGFAAPLIRKRFPECRFVVVLRDPAEVAQSLERFGIRNQLPELERRYADLLALSADPEVLTVDYHALSQLETCRAVFERCTGKPLDTQWWVQLANLNIQVDMALEFARIQASAHLRDALWREAKRELSTPGLDIAVEAWSPQLWAEAQAMADDHFEETAGGLEPRRVFQMDRRLMALMQQQGALRIVTARYDGELVGYLTWQIGPDVESEGLLKADQGGFYVKPGHPKAMDLMYERSHEVLRVAGVKLAIPHHPLQGRGARLGRYFERKGAKPMHHTYSWWIA